MAHVSVRTSRHGGRDRGRGTCRKAREQAGRVGMQCIGAEGGGAGGAAIPCDLGVGEQT